METLIISFFGFIKIVTAEGSAPTNTLKIKLSVASDSKWEMGFKNLFVRFCTLLFYLLFILVFAGFIAISKVQDV